MLHLISPRSEGTSNSNPTFLHAKRVSSGSNSANGIIVFCEHLASNLSPSLTSGQVNTEVSVNAADELTLSSTFLSGGTEGTMANEDLDFRGVTISSSL